MQFERLTCTPAQWDLMREGFRDRTVFQSSAWLAFVAETQQAVPIRAAITENGSTLGFFVGLVVQKYGLRILGSPFPGWTTSYMGFNLADESLRPRAVREAFRFAFSELHCVHAEVMDRELASHCMAGADYGRRTYRSDEIDLRPTEPQLLANMSPNRRQNLRKALRCGLMVQEADDDHFAVEFHAQLCDVFAKQRLVPTYGLERVRSLIRQLRGTGMMLLLRVRDPDGRCIATNISVGLNRTAHFWGAASWRAHQILRPNELITWYAIRYWKAKGCERFDFCGAGDYKKRYGAHEIQVPWVHKSKYPLLQYLRDSAKRAVHARQWILGHWGIHSHQPAARTAVLS